MDLITEDDQTFEEMFIFDYGSTRSEIRGIAIDKKISKVRLSFRNFGDQKQLGVSHILFYSEEMKVEKKESPSKTFQLQQQIIKKLTTS